MTSLATMDDLELPPNPPPSSLRSRPAVLTRKRTRDDYNDDVPTSAASSDPAMFSGDETVPDAENYALKRKKKMYTGSWWSHRVKANRDDKQREFKRNYDSGVFMGSEGSEPPSSDSLGSLEEELIQDQLRMELEQKPAPKASSTKSRPLMRAASLPFKYRMPDTPLEHARVMHIVQTCLDKGTESVDLSSMALASLPTEITSLMTLTKHTNLVEGMLDHGELLEAQLRLFLGNNLLRRVPRELLGLTNLRFLSLRQNKLTSLPPGIRDLINLEHLNVAGNRLSSLPFEIIELMRCHRLGDVIAEPNPWQPRPDTMATSFGYTDCVSADLQTYILRCDPRNVTDHHSPRDAGSTVPSLTEMTLRSLSRLGAQSDLGDYMPSDTPLSILKALSTLHESHLDGGYRCSRCHRAMVQSGFERLEWWTLKHARPLGSDSLTYPFKRMFCRYDCEGKRNSWCDDIAVGMT